MIVNLERVATEASVLGYKADSISIGSGIVCIMSFC